MLFEEFKNCGLRKTLDMISGKWKPLILSNLFEQEEVRFVELWRKMPKVSKKFWQNSSNKWRKIISFNGLKSTIFLRKYIIN
jgi:hypothetical protein